MLEAKMKVDTRGGARAGAGRKSAALEEGVKDSLIVYNKAKADHEVWKAKSAELEYKYKSGEYLTRDDVRNSSAVIIASLAQTFRNMPDFIERKAGIDSATLKIIQDIVDATLNETAEALKRLHER